MRPTSTSSPPEGSPPASRSRPTSAAAVRPGWTACWAPRRSRPRWPPATSTPWGEAPAADRRAGVHPQPDRQRGRAPRPRPAGRPGTGRPGRPGQPGHRRRPGGAQAAPDKATGELVAMVTTEQERLAEQAAEAGQSQWWPTMRPPRARLRPSTPRGRRGEVRPVEAGCALHLGGGRPGYVRLLGPGPVGVVRGGRAPRPLHRLPVRRDHPHRRRRPPSGRPGVLLGCGRDGRPGSRRALHRQRADAHAPHAGGNVMLSSIYYWPSGTFSASRVVDPANPAPK